MFIFLVLLALFLVLFALFIYMNINNYFKIDYSPLDSDTDFFSQNSGYYQLNNSWLELTPGSSQEGGFCLDSSSCSNGDCYTNPATNENACYSSKADADRNGFVNPVPDNPSLFNYGVNTLYTAICAQKAIIGQTFSSYYPDYKSQLLIKENNINFGTDCENYTFQQTINPNLQCYDVDQLSGTKIVELCQANEAKNNICIDTNGDKVYYPSINPLFIKPSSDLCEDNTSINYISFNFNNIPQQIRTLYKGSGNLGLYANQIYCLSLDDITYYTNFSVVSYTDSGKNTNYYVTFSGTWGFMYSYVLSSTNPAEQVLTANSIGGFTWYDTDLNRPLKSPVDNFKIENIVNRLKIDFAYGITYVIPALEITNLGVKIGNNILNIGNIIDTISLGPKYKIVSSISVKPCAMFDTSYVEINNSDTYLLGDSKVDKQKFKVERFSINTDTTDPAYGSYKNDPKGMICSIMYRNLNYENGGLYLDYYVPPTNTEDIDEKCPTYLDMKNEGLIFRKNYPEENDAMKKWILMPPLELSPYTIPSGENMWCNFAYDISKDGGHTFNGGDSVVVPMETVTIGEGQEIIDPVYKSLTSQPNNNLFSKIGEVFEIGGAAVGLTTAPPISTEAIFTGLDLWGLSHGKTEFNWENVDAAFGRCSQLCSSTVTAENFPTVKAVALNSGNLGSMPPGYDRGPTQDFSKGDVLFGLKVGGLTCAWFYQYKNTGTNAIASRSPGDIYRDGSVDFIIEDVFNNTYLFDKSYFNDQNVIVLNSIVSGGKGYGITTPPQNCIVSFNHNIQNLKQSFTSGSYEPKVPTCKKGNLAKCTLDNSISHSEACGQYSIIEEILNNLNNENWYVDVNDTDLEMKIGFMSPPCDNQTVGSELYYVLVFLMPYFEAYEVSQGSFQNSVVITNINKYFPSASDPTKTNYDLFVIDENGNKEFLFDENGNKLIVEATLGDFSVQQRLYYENTPVAIVDFLVQPGDNGAIANIDDLEIVAILDIDVINQNIGKNVDYNLQEWWVIQTNFMNIPKTIEYRNLKASGCVVKLGESDSIWNVLERAPKNLIRENNPSLKFPPGDPMSLLNNSILQHGPSSQQIVYAGSFEDTNQSCFKLKKDECLNSELCSWNDTNSYCIGKSLLDITSEKYGYIFTNTEEFDPSIFNTKDDGSHFTDITFLKSLQLSNLNYAEYKFMEGQEIIGSSPISYLEKPNFIDYQQEGIDNFGNINKSINESIGNGPNITLGRFIPYQYFYPTFIKDTQIEDDADTTTKHTVGIETSAISVFEDPSASTSLVNNFYVNFNETQFIPYGKKSLYENGFDSQNDVPTF